MNLYSPLIASDSQPRDCGGVAKPKSVSRLVRLYTLPADIRPARRAPAVLRAVRVVARQLPPVSWAALGCGALLGLAIALWW